MQDRNNRVGDLLLSKYRLTRHLGGGGFAQVYQAEHIQLNQRFVAVKTLTPGFANEDIRQFHREAQVLALLNHPGIVRLLDYDIEGHSPFIVMEYAPNGSLRQQVAPGQRISLPTVVSYVKQIAAAMQFAHDHHLLHRDVKPGNILLGKQNELLLSDFGIAQLTRSMRTQSVLDVIGTVTYMAPEQLQGKPTRASDQYALGIMVYEWLTGRPPFLGKTTIQLSLQHIQSAVPPLRQLSFMIPQLVEKVVLQTLAKNPEDRFACVSAFADALEGAVEQSVRNATYPTIREKK
jgi:serine/threonine protein kinase